MTHEPILSMGCVAYSLRNLQCGMILKYNKFICLSYRRLQQIQDKTERLRFYKGRLLQMSTGKLKIKCSVLRLCLQEHGE